MNVTPKHFIDAQPLTSSGLEPAASRATVIVSTSSPFCVEGRQTNGFIAGPRLEPLQVTYPDRASCFEWSFSVFDVERTFGVHAREISNAVIDLVDLPRTQSARRIQDGLSVSTDDCELYRDSGLARFAWTQLEHQRVSSLSALSKKVGIGARRLEQIFARQIGLSPKQLQSLLRYETALNVLRGEQSSLAEIALICGYSDQSHMNRELRRYSGITPAQWRSILQSTR